VYGGARLKVWQVIVLGALWIALGIILDQAIDWDPPRTGYIVYRRRGAHELFVALKLWITGPVLIGLWHWFRAWQASQIEHAAGESAMHLPVQKPAKKTPPSASLPPPPRIGDDPFRNPPAPAPIVVHRPPTAPAAPPMAAASGDPDDKPKLLV
jgi:hypothetical protein